VKNGGPPLFRKSFYKVFFFFRGEGEIVTPMLSQSIFILFFDSTSENIPGKRQSEICKTPVCNSP